LSCFCNKISLSCFFFLVVSLPDPLLFLDRFAHLTNHQIQKDYEGNQGIEGTQWSLKQFKDHLTSSSSPSSSSSTPAAASSSSSSFSPPSSSSSSDEKEGIWETQIEPKIRELIVDSLRTWPIEGHRERSFELLGYDIMLDQELNPYLLEININPGLHLLTDVVGDHHPQVVAGLFNGISSFLFCSPSLLPELLVSSLSFDPTRHFSSFNPLLVLSSCSFLKLVILFYFFDLLLCCSYGGPSRSLAVTSDCWSQRTRKGEPHSTLRWLEADLSWSQCTFLR
jgi:hypothetical protein